MSGPRVVEGGRVAAASGPVAPVRWLSHRQAAERLRVSETRVRELMVGGWVEVTGTDTANGREVEVLGPTARAIDEMKKRSAR